MDPIHPLGAKNFNLQKLISSNHLGFMQISMVQIYKDFNLIVHGQIQLQGFLFISYVPMPLLDYDD